MIAYQFGALTATIIIWLLLLQLVHWIVRKIFRRPRKPLLDWLKSWIAGPELFLIGAVWVTVYEGSPRDQFSYILGGFLFWVGLIIFVIKIIASLVSRFRRRTPAAAPVSPPASPPVSTPPQPLGRQPRLG